MALFVNTAELKRDTNHVLRQIVREPAIITRHGHPCAALIPVSEKELEELFWEISPKIRKKITKGFKEMKQRKIVVFITGYGPQS